MKTAILRRVSLLVLLTFGVLGSFRVPEASAAAKAHIIVSTRIIVQAAPDPTVTLTTVGGRTLVIESIASYQKQMGHVKADAVVLFGVTPRQFPFLATTLRLAPNRQIYLALSQVPHSMVKELPAPLGTSTVLTHKAVQVSGVGYLSVTALAQSESGLSHFAIVRIELPHVSIGIAYPARLPFVHELPEEDEILILHPDVLPFLDRSPSLTTVDPDMAIVLASRRQVMATANGEAAIETLREWWIDVYTIEGKAIEIDAGPHGVLLPSTRPVR